MQPLVSVLMTAYNREEYIAEAIQSVMQSTYSNWELIICDDCSRDKTVEIARSYEAKDERIKVFINEKNLGDYPNRNKAASHANGKYLKYLDSDDLIYYYGLEVMINYMERFPEAGFGLASYVEDTRPFPICIQPREIYFEGFGRFDHFGRAPGSAIIKREVFEKLGGFSGKRMIGDTEFWLKCARYYPMVKFPFDLYWSRVHNSREAVTEYAFAQYEKLRKGVIEAALLHNDCPLKVDEIQGIKKMLWKRKLKHKGIQILSKVIKRKK
jgi:glycosyltransferase involved in cell wall biosynthesis